MNNKARAAVGLVKRGFKIFPLVENGKTPKVSSFYDKALSDEKKLELYYTKYPRDNIGISTTDIASGEGLLVIDVDNKGEKKGSETLIELAMEGFELPPTTIQETPTGGFHLIYKVPKAVSQNVQKIGPGLDVRSYHGYIVGAGSIVEAGEYTINDTPIADAPAWLIEKCGEPRTKNPTMIVPVALSIDKSVILSRCEEYLLTAPLAVEGEGGDSTTYKVASKLHALGATVTQAFDLMRDNWNDKCQPPWDLNELWRKISNAYVYAKEPQGSELPEAQFDQVSPEGPSELHEMNRRFAFVKQGSTHFIVEETIDEYGKPELREYLENTFKTANIGMVQMDGKIQKTASAWLQWEGRRTYDKIVFMPNVKTSRRFYNLWKGFEVKPTAYDRANTSARKGFNDFMSHLRQNIAGGNEEHANYLLGFFAHMIQKPEEKPLVALVFQGGKGVGKNAMIERVAKLLPPQNFKIADDPRYLISNFNGHFEQCLLFVLDEAVWGGDTKHNGKLKGLITGDSILIEKKNREPYTVKNLLRLVIMGNEEWLVPASMDERRYAVFRVGEGRKQDRSFFESMRINMDLNGGNEILMHYLLNFDLSTVEVNNPPATEALIEQKEESYDYFESFFSECLFEGRIVGHFGDDGWPERIRTSELLDAYKKHAKANGCRFVDSVWKLTKKIRDFVDSTKVVAYGEERHRSYFLKSLQECRDLWDKRKGVTTDWS